MRVYLRPVTLNDGPMLVKWRNSPNVINHCFNREPITIESNEHFYKEYILNGKYKQFIVERVDDQYGVVSYGIASISLKDIDYTNRRCEICIFTSDEEEWNSESQSLALQLLLKRAFEEYGMQKIYSYVFTYFMNELSLLLLNGFKVEGLLKNEILNECGLREDVYRVVVFKDEWMRKYL